MKTQFYCCSCFKHKEIDLLHGYRNKKARCKDCAFKALKNLDEDSIVFVSHATGPLTRSMRNENHAKYYLNGKFKLPE